MTPRERAERLVVWLFAEASHGRAPAPSMADHITAEFEAVREETARKIATAIRSGPDCPDAIVTQGQADGVAEWIERGDWKKRDGE